MNVMPVACWRPDPASADAWLGVGASVATPEGALATLRAAAAAGRLLRDESPGLYACRITVGSASQLGIVAALAVDDLARALGAYPAGDIDTAVERMSVTGAQLDPAIVSVPDDGALSVLVALAATGQPLYDLAGDGGVRVAVWRVSRVAAVEAIVALMGRADRARLVGGVDAAWAMLALRSRRIACGVGVGDADAALCLLVPGAVDGSVSAHIFPGALLMRRV